MKCKLKKILKKTLTIIVVSIIVGFLFLFLVYLIPTNSMKENVKDSLSVFEKEGDYYNLITDNKSTQLDNFTDALMLQNAIYDGGQGSTIDKAISVYRYTGLNYNSTAYSLISTIKEEDSMILISYRRYWHGYLVLLKPLLVFFNYQEIRLINFVIQILLIVCICYLFIKKKADRVILPYILSLTSIYPNVISQSLQFSIMFYIFNFGMLFVLKYNCWLKKANNYLYLFLMLGIITSYMDFFTCPLTGLLMPLICYLLLNFEDYFWKNVKIIVCSIFFWIIGYTIMWASKWLVGSILIGKNIWAEAKASIVFRTSAISNRFTAIINNFEYFIFIFLICSLILMFYVITNLVCKKIKFSKKNILKYLPILFLGLIPFAWYIIVNNHSLHHAWFTYRNLVIFAFSLYIYVTTLFEINDK